MIQANSLQIPLKDESVQCTICSPPYWGLRDYGTATWEGGKDGCDHIGSDRWYTESTAAGSSSEAFSNPGQDNIDRVKKGRWREAGQCTKCGAKRIDNQLGLEKTPEEYIENTVTWAREVWRVLRKDGCFFLNLGDSYWGGKGSSGQGSAEYQNNRQDVSINKPTSHIGGHGKTRPQDGKHTTLKPKDLCGIPFKVAFALQEAGWYLRSAMPWVKRSAMPESCSDRPTSALEYMFLLTKSGTSQYWTHRDFSGVRERPKPDWRWQHQAEGIELEEAPPGWADMLIPCPACDGTGYENKFVNTDLFGETQTTWGSICENCKDTEYVTIGELGGEDVRLIKEWKRINLWQGHDYYFDMDAIRKKQVEYERQRRLRERSKGLSSNYKIASEGKTGQNPQSKSGAIKNVERRHELAETGSRNFRNTDLFYQSLEEPHGMIFCGEEMVGFDVNPQPYSEAHFATFPEWLVIPLIKAGTSEKGACPECGAPWERLTETPQWYKELDGHKMKSGTLAEGVNAGFGAKKDSVSKPIKTIGWQPTCSHKAEPVSCVVLDNFGGSGTTKNVADRLGRYGVLCELKMEYIEMAKKRCYKLPGLF